MQKKQATGDVIVFVDSVGNQHSALVTAWWGPDCCNLVIVSGDEQKRDDYGRQTERYTSVSRKTEGHPHGNYFMEVGEEPLPYTPPSAV
jgi:hypothetical protein